MTLLQNIKDLNLILITIYCFVDDFLKGIVANIKYALARPGKNYPPIKKHNLGLAELASLAIFRFFTGHKNWKDFYQHIKTYHKRDFSNLPNYQNFLKAVNELMQILKLKFTAATGDERKTLEMMWNNIFGMIIADAGYVSKKLQEKAFGLGKILLTGVRANMKKIMTETERQLLKLRQLAETVYSVLKLRVGLETTLPRSPLGYFAHYIWRITAYQLKKFFELLFAKPKLA